MGMVNVDEDEDNDSQEESEESNNNTSNDGGQKDSKQKKETKYPPPNLTQDVLNRLLWLICKYWALTYEKLQTILKNYRILKSRY